MTSAPPEPKLQPKNPGVEKPEGFFVKNSCIVRKSVIPHFGALLGRPENNLRTILERPEPERLRALDKLGPDGRTD